MRLTESITIFKIGMGMLRKFNDRSQRWLIHNVRGFFKIWLY